MPRDLRARCGVEKKIIAGSFLSAVSDAERGNKMTQRMFNNDYDPAVTFKTLKARNRKRKSMKSQVAETSNHHQPPSFNCFKFQDTKGAENGK
jgi:hypothetical protein